MTEKPFDFVTFLAERGPAVHRGVRAKLGPNGGEFEDVVQEVFARLWEHRSRFKTMGEAEGACLTWAARITIDNARKARSIPHGTLEPLEALAGTAPDPVHEVEARALLALVREVLSCRQAAVWFGSVVEGRDRADLADRHGMTENAVSAVLYRAWRRLSAHKERFRLVAGFGVFLARPRAGSSARASAGWCGALATTVVGIGLMAVTPYTRDTFDAHGTDAQVSRADAVRAPAAPTVPAPAGRRALDGVPRPLRPGVAATDAGEETAVTRGKFARCLPGAVVVCTATRGDDSTERSGHGVWFGRTPFTQEHEVRQHDVPVCDHMRVLPESEHYGCTRYGPAHSPVRRHDVHPTAAGGVA